MKPLLMCDITTNLQKKITKQDYSKKTVIAGVKIIDLNFFSDESGYFLELSRWQKSIMQHFPDFALQQISYSEMDPGAIKAWHLHLKQEDIWFVPPSSKLLLLLRDCRAKSGTTGILMRLVLGAGKARLVYIPRGVAHGAANLSTAVVGIIYFMNNQFSLEPKQCDEQRLPWDIFGKDIWQMRKE